MAPSVAAGGGTQAVVAPLDPAAVTVVGYGGGEVALLTETVTAFLSDGVLVLLDAASGEQTLVWPDTDATGSAGHGMRCSSPDGDSGGGGHRSLNGGRRQAQHGQSAAAEVALAIWREAASSAPHSQLAASYWTAAASTAPSRQPAAAAALAASGASQCVQPLARPGDCSAGTIWGQGTAGRGQCGAPCLQPRRAAAAGSLWRTNNTATLFTYSGDDVPAESSGRGERGGGLPAGEWVEAMAAQLGPELVGVGASFYPGDTALRGGQLGSCASGRAVRESLLSPTIFRAAAAAAAAVAAARWAVKAAAAAAAATTALRQSPVRETAAEQAPHWTAAASSALLSQLEAAAAAAEAAGLTRCI
eukprot:CAMPEP_0181348404 /NCGR_PEP_ID=MMETSP1106-20121128/155_1 /TAXON_ID=81844 /ORGANISM="Mantoniella antarctica, Strain SL-175" /LENGTH=360 /DNA_ID=CAMNT_0023460689 /DNA_START=139 /DNA_END=1225 /DNA_ORIENTATION=-